MIVLNIQQIMDILPHRYPFLLVDRIEEVEEGKKANGYKNVTINEPFFQGHFPGHPIMPGVLIIEAMAQVGGAYVSVADVYLMTRLLTLLALIMQNSVNLYCLVISYGWKWSFFPSAEVSTSFLGKLMSGRPSLQKLL